MSDYAHSGTTRRTDRQTSTRRQFLAILSAETLRPSMGGECVHARPTPHVTPLRTDHAVRIDDRPTQVSVAVPRAHYQRVTDAEHSFASAFAAAKRQPYLNRVTADLATRATGRASAIRATQSLAANIEYVTDKQSTGEAEFIRYPAETLVDGRGDCEDKAILLAGLLDCPPLDCRTALLVVRHHCATLVARPDLPQTLIAADPVSVTLDGTEFVYVEAVETTRIGQAAADYGGRTKVAAYDGHWTVLNVDALVEWTREAVDRRGLDFVTDIVS